MTWVVRFHPEAEEELRTAQQWYEQQRAGLGSDLLLCVEESLQKIERPPESYPTVHQYVRQVIVRRFPYTILYSIERKEISTVSNARKSLFTRFFTQVAILLYGKIASE